MAGPRADGHNRGVKTLGRAARLLTVLALAAPTHVAGARGGPPTYYVSTTGDDASAGTLSAPWRTIQKAASTVEAGSTVYVRGGVYDEAVTVEVSGSAEAGYTRFASYPGETAVVDGSGLTVPEGDAALFLIVDRSYVIVQGFELRNYASAERGVTPGGVHVRGASHHVEIRDNRIHDIATNYPGTPGGDAQGVVVYGTSATEPAHDIVVDGNELYDLKLGSSEALALNGNVEGFAVTNNVVRDCDNIGIVCIGYEGTAPDPDVDRARDGTVAGNTVYGIDSFGNPAYGEERSAGGIYVDGGADIVVERNVVHDSNLGVELASEHRGRATSRVTLRDNLLYENQVAGLSIGGYDKRRGTTEDCTIVNNTLYHNDTLETGTGEIDLQFSPRGNTIRDNVVCAGAQGKLIGNEFKKSRDNDVDANLYSVPDGVEPSWQWRRKTYTSFDAYRAASGNDATTVIADPLLGADLRLTAGSPAIDAGDASVDAGALDLDGGPRVVGTRIDLGADEWDG